MSTFFRLESVKNIFKDLKEIINGDVFEFHDNDKYSKSIWISNHQNVIMIYIYNNKFFDDVFNIFDDFNINSYFLKLNKILNYNDILETIKIKFENINFNDFEGNEIENFINNLIYKYKNYEKNLKLLKSTIYKYIKEINNDYFKISYNFWDEIKEFKQEILKFNKKDNSTYLKIIIFIKKFYFLFKKFDFIENSDEINKRFDLLNLEHKQCYENYIKDIPINFNISLNQDINIHFSATGRIKSINFPFRNYIVPKNFDIYFNNSKDTEKINLENENIPPSVVGSTVEYLTHFMMGEKIETAFKVALEGVPYIFRNFKKGITDERIKKILYDIKGLDDNSIEIACKISALDCWKGGAIAILAFKPIKKVNNITIKNIRKMVERSLKFWQKNGPIIKNNYIFDGGWTKLIPKGQAEGDFMTKDTLWDFKTSIQDPIKNNKYVLQLIIYYVMGIHSNIPEFKNIKKIGFFNPRLNKVYVASLDILSNESIKEIEKDIIGYF